MTLASLLAKATAMPGFELWRGLAPRRFFTEHLLADFIRATEVLPADNAKGVFAVITTSPLGLPKALPSSWQEIDSLGDYFATFRAPVGTTARAAAEALALELVPLFYPAESYEQQLTIWLTEELSASNLPAPAPAVIDIPSPRNYHNTKSEAEADLDFLYGNGRTPPSYHGYDCTDRVCPVSGLTYGPPEVSDVAIQESEEAPFYFG